VKTSLRHSGQVAKVKTSLRRPCHPCKKKNKEKKEKKRKETISTMRVCMQMFYGGEEASPLQVGGCRHNDKECHQCLLHGQPHFQGMCKVFCDLNHYRKVPNHYRKVLNHYRKVLNPYRKVLNPYRKVLNHYRKLPVEGCYGRGEFLMKI